MKGRVGGGGREVGVEGIVKRERDSVRRREVVGVVEGGGKKTRKRPVSTTIAGKATLGGLELSVEQLGFTVLGYQG